MPSLKSIRKRVSSVKNTQKITKAMKMVAAAKLRRAQDQIHAFRPYANQLQRVVVDLLEKLSLEDPEKQPANSAAARALFVHRPEQRIQLILLNSDRGLAGAFNSNIFRRAELLLVEKEKAAFDWVVIGRKGREYVQRRLRDRQTHVRLSPAWHQSELYKDWAGIDPKTILLYAQELTKTALEDFTSGKVDAVYVVHNQFVNAARQVVHVQQLLPLSQPHAHIPADAAGVLLDYVYEPSKIEVLTQLLPLYVQTQMQRMLFDSLASELGARMSAMDNASRNAKEMISKLTLQLNRARQALITKELMEIIGGSEAIKG